MNIQGQINNNEELKYVIKKRKPDICVCSESHLTEDVLNSEIQIKGYTILRTDSSSPRTGGVCVFMKKNLKIKNVRSHSTDFIWINSFDLYTSNNKYVKIVAIYMSASARKTDILDYFEKWCEENIINCDIILCGDFNIDMLKTNLYKDRLLNICSDNGLKQLVKNVTRCTDRSSTIIDLCFSNIRSEVNVLIEDQITDHRNIEIKFIVTSSVRNSREYKTIKVWRGYSTDVLHDGSIHGRISGIK